MYDGGGGKRKKINKYALGEGKKSPYQLDEAAAGANERRKRRRVVHYYHTCEMCTCVHVCVCVCITTT